MNVFGNIVGKEENAGKQHFSSFPKMLSILQKTNSSDILNYILFYRLQVLNLAPFKVKIQRRFKQDEHDGPISLT